MESQALTLTLDALPAEAFAFFAVFARIGAMAMVMPGFGELTLSPRIRLMIALGLTVAIAPLVSATLPAMPGSAFAVTIFIGGEVIIGIAVGLLARLVMGAIQVAGTAISYQSGLAFAQSFDPTQGTQSAVISTFLSLVAVTLIFMTDMHQLLILAMRDSYTLFMPGGEIPVGDFAELAVRTLSGLFVIALQMAAPFIMFGLIFYLGLGLLSRLMPQVQIFFVAMPANILMGFVILSLVLGIIMTWFLEHFEAHMSQFLAG
jgi:flagellar biosynthetic protein FliR